MNIPDLSEQFLILNRIIQMYLHVRDALCDLIPFVQFEKRENKVAGSRF